MTHDYAKGQFQSYRAITKIHLGAISDNLSEGEEIQYDGHVLRRGNDEHSLHSLRAAIKVGCSDSCGWFKAFPTFIGFSESHVND